MEVQGIYGVSRTIYFPLITAGGTDFQTTWTPAAAECQVSIDGAAFGNSDNTPAHEGNGVWSLVLSASEMSGEIIVVTLSDSATDIEDQAIIVNTILSGHLEALQAVFIGEVDTATFTATATQFEALKLWPGVTEPTVADQLLDRRFLITSGTMTGEGGNIDAYVLANSKFKFTVPTMSAVPADGTRFVIL